MHVSLLLRECTSPSLRVLTRAAAPTILACIAIQSPQPLTAQQPSGVLPRESAPALSQFPRDLAFNFKGLWSRDNLRPLLVGSSVTAAAIPADGSVANYFADGPRWQGFDTVGKHLGSSQVMGPAIGVSFLVSRTISNRKFQSFTYSLAQGFIVSNTATGGIKAISGRKRPDESSRLSFPSGHTANSFMLASVASRSYGWKAGVPAYAFAAYVGASRLQSNKHFLTDVIAGATLGYIVGRTVTRRRSYRERRVQWGVGVPPGGGAALSVGIRP